MSEYTYSLKKISQHRYTAFLFKTLILLGTLWYISYSFVQHGQTIDQIIRQCKQAIVSSQAFYFVLPLLLIPVNWGLEAFKWKLLVCKVEKISFAQAYKGILTGLSMGFVTPRMLGDYAGRIWQLESQQRYQAIGAIWLGRFSQLCITLLAGSWAAIYFFYSRLPLYASISILLGSIFCSGIGLSFLFLGKKIVAKLHAVQILSPFWKYINVLGTYSAKEILTLLGFAALRYCIFSLQFYIILGLFGLSLAPLELLSSICLIFFAKSVVPTFSFLVDLGMRESAALYIFTSYGVEPAPIVAACLSLWLANILFPALIGSVLLIQMKIAQ